MNWYWLKHYFAEPVPCFRDVRAVAVFLAAAQTVAFTYSSSSSDSSETRETKKWNKWSKTSKFHTENSWSSALCIKTQTQCLTGFVFAWCQLIQDGLKAQTLQPKSCTLHNHNPLVPHCFWWEILIKRHDFKKMGAQLIKKWN